MTHWYNTHPDFEGSVWTVEDLYWSIQFNDPSPGIPPEKIEDFWLLAGPLFLAFGDAGYRHLVEFLRKTISDMHKVEYGEWLV